jgi:phosphatidylglycerophosphatase A
MVETSNGSSRARKWITVSLAQGLGIGRIPWAPGTWGSILGLGWYWLLIRLAPDPSWFFLTAGLAALASIWICGQAELILKQQDPSSVVLDEIVALPFCFSLTLSGASTHPSHFWREASAGFVLFRLFDITKPPPIRQLQNLHGGLGVVIDDLAAALVSAVCLWGLHKTGVLTPLT